MNNIFDSHAHYTDSAFDADRDALLASLPGAGICGVICCGTDIPDSKAAAALAERYPYVYAAAGIHPHEAAGAPEDTERVLGELLTCGGCVALGEIGLDYHYDFSPREQQLTVFERQLALAVNLDIPVIIHDREAHEDVYRLLKEYKPRGVVHCFSGSAQSACELADAGMYIGLGGAVTFKNARKPLEVAACVPQDRLLVETDCPYMTPVPFRGKRCDSTYISYTACVIAAVRETEPQLLLDLTAKNAYELFLKRLSSGKADDSQ